MKHIINRKSEQIYGNLVVFSYISGFPMWGMFSMHEDINSHKLPILLTSGEAVRQKHGNVPCTCYFLNYRIDPYKCIIISMVSLILSHGLNVKINRFHNTYIKHDCKPKS